MATSRFECYVEECMKELTAGKRAKLQAAYDTEVAKIEKQRDKYLKMVKDGVETLVRKGAVQAMRDGCDTGGDEIEDAKETLSTYVGDQIRTMFGPRTKYDRVSGERLWPEGTPARKAQDALRAFDALCAKEVKRIVVYKMDLGMKPEAFEKMLAETAEKIGKE